MRIDAASYNRETGEAEITISFVAELTSCVRDHEGKTVEGSPNDIRKQNDIWTFARTVGSDDPNWRLVATDA